jgi:O-antigen/teichoic acid export membrane protein
MSNSIWGVVSNLAQNLLFSIFFVVVARVYAKEEFGEYIIANTLYSFMLAFSSLGLGHWFIREIIQTEDKKTITRTFFKVQLLIGVFFYGINLLTTYLLYQDPMIRTLSIIIGINLIFDNIINVIKSLNIANEEQKKTFALLTIEAALKCGIALFLLFQKIDLVWLSVLLIFLRLITLNLFISMGSSRSIGIWEILSVRVKWSQIRALVFSNWAFIVISSMSILNWRIGNILVSKWLSLDDVAHYEISFKLFSLAYLIPIIVSQSIYPQLIQALGVNRESLKSMYQKAYWPMFIYGFLAFCFVYAYSDTILPWLFGEKYQAASIYCKQMFAVLLIFPTIILQANVLLALKLEKLDMMCNVFAVLVNVLICVVGLTWYKDLTVINIAIFSSFFVFHLIQDLILVKQKITTLYHVFSFYLIAGIGTFTFIGLHDWMDSGWSFICFLILMLSIGFIFFSKIKRHYIIIN